VSSVSNGLYFLTLPLVSVMIEHGSLNFKKLNVFKFGILLIRFKVLKLVSVRKFSELIV
jgi:hypothetical protein